MHLDLLPCGRKAIGVDSFEALLRTSHEGVPQQLRIETRKKKLLIPRRAFFISFSEQLDSNMDALLQSSPAHQI